MAAIVRPLNGNAQSIEELRNLSVEQLGEIQVSVVSRSALAVSDAPASVFVITQQDIIRSGAQTVPEMLRLAPNLEVAQLNSNSYAISARGFNVGNNASLSNKLLVMVDGRSVYSPMFGGVYWDMLDVPAENIDRIEVISGPGAALWGANAVNGVINIVTRPSGETQGGVLTLGAGNYVRDGFLQYGGRLGPNLTYRAYTDIYNSSAFPLSNGQSAGDAWNRPSGGFRLDWTPQNDAVSLEGNLLTAHISPDQFIRDDVLSASWLHRFSDGSSLQLLTWFDNTARTVNNGPAFWLDTYDIEVQHNFTFAGWNDIVWGVGERAFRYRFENRALALEPSSQTLNLANAFVQDTISLSSRLKLTLGMKVEDEPYAGLQAMPSVRIAWKPVDTALLWAAVSRALRSPTPVDTNLREFAGPTLVLSGSTSFRPEKLTSYEIGTRVQVTTRASLSVSAYYNVYDDLRSIDRGSPLSGSTFVFGNQMAGTTYGLEVWGAYQLTTWWRLSAGFNLLHEDLRFLPGSVTVAGLAFVSDDPGHQAFLRSSMNLGERVTLDADLREVGSLPHPSVPGYVELNGRIGWTVNERLQLSLTGYNLLHARHQEFFEPGVTTYIPRSFLAQARIRF